jgi:hypothetical protein
VRRYVRGEHAILSRARIDVRAVVEQERNALGLTESVPHRQLTSERACVRAHTYHVGRDGLVERRPKVARATVGRRVVSARRRRGVCGAVVARQVHVDAVPAPTARGARVSMHARANTRANALDEQVAHVNAPNTNGFVERRDACAQAMALSAVRRSARTSTCVPSCARANARSGAMLLLRRGK